MCKKRESVFFTNDISSVGLEKVMQPILPNLKGKIGVKVHFGEKRNIYFIRPELFKSVVLKLNGNFIETNVLYGGPRRLTESHVSLAREHGFDYAPIDIIDDPGELSIPYKGKYFQEVYTGKNIELYDSILVISHFKGHPVAGFGGAVKNVGMGMASIRGKMEQHADSNPVVKANSCIICGKCISECPMDAITLNPLQIDTNKCIACGKCIGTCPTSSLRVPWGKTGENGFLERMADYAKAISCLKPMVFINFLTQISPDCDCFDEARSPFIKDIGILASTDMLAIDKASADLVDQFFGKSDTFKHINNVSGRYLFSYGEKINLGSIKYDLVNLDTP